MLQLCVQVPNERAASDDLSVAIVERQAAVAHVLAVYTLCPRGDADHLGFLDVSACVGGKVFKGSAGYRPASYPQPHLFGFANKL